MTARTPPQPSGNLQDWSRQLYTYLASEAHVKDRVEPSSVLLAHQTDAISERAAAVDGLLLYDPTLNKPVFSKGGAFTPLATLDDLPEPQPPVPPFATTEEAIAGQVTDKIMSPALVSARSGFVNITADGLTQITFSAVPPEANSLQLMLNNLTYAAAELRFSFGNSPDQNNGTVNVQDMRDTYSRPVSAPASHVPLTFAGSGSAFGLVTLESSSDSANSGAWFINAQVRAGANSLFLAGGRMIRSSTQLPPGTLTPFRLRLSTNAAFLSGSAIMRWRI